MAITVLNLSFGGSFFRSFGKKIEYGVPLYVFFRAEPVSTEKDI
jgi:hypothetical protein